MPILNIRRRALAARSGVPTVPCHPRGLSVVNSRRTWTPSFGSLCSFCIPAAYHFSIKFPIDVLSAKIMPNGPETIQEGPERGIHWTQIAVVLEVQVGMWKRWFRVNDPEQHFVRNVFQRASRMLEHGESSNPTTTSYLAAIQIQSTPILPASRQANQPPRIQDPSLQPPSPLASRHPGIQASKPAGSESTIFL